MSCKTDRVLVLGIGNTLLSDEGAGVHAVRQLQQQASAAGRSGIEYVDGGTLSFTLAGPIEESDAVVIIDAADFGAQAGAVRVFEGAAMDDFLGTERKRSVHEVGLRDLMAVAALAGRLPERRALIGIQPLELGWGEAPSPRVAEGISRACARAREIIQRWDA
jgi:hydrogenase maturation protease